MCKEAGMLAHASFMVGLPGESPETLRDTHEFSQSLGIPYGYHFLAPFPGTTVREKIEEYDLEILTDDWERYDANSAIVRTSALSPEDIEKFVAVFDREINDAWEKQVRDYREGRGLPEDNFRVEGHFRMQLVYRMLSEDLIETCGCFPMEHASDNGTVDMLCAKIEEKTGFDPGLIRKTIEDFIGAGYIKPGRAGENLAWYWTHNIKVD